jgi:polyisoprenyl-phosphate glycosyltransferase
MNQSDVDFSIIIPVYYNAGSLNLIYKAIEGKVIERNPGKKCEIIFVDDGSGDNSFDELMQIRNEHPDIVKIIKFIRNFGQLNAIMAGYKLARGKCVISISADLQDPPELINDMIDYHFNKGFQIVVCSRESRDESFFRRGTSQFFYYMMKKLSFPNMPTKGFDYVLLSDKVKNIILNNQESNAFFQGQILWTGFNIKFIPYKREKRAIGKSRWTFSKKLKYLLDGVLSYSYFPLRAMSVTGLIVSLLGFLYAITIFISRLFGSVPVQGWAPLMIIILVLSGIQMLMLGIIGEYLWRALDQVRKRQPYIIDKILE